MLMLRRVLVVLAGVLAVGVPLFGAAQAFAEGAGLPDGRGYELVSAGNQNSNVSEPILNPPSWNNEGLSGGGGLGDSTYLPFQAAVDGGAVVYPGDPPPVGGNGSIGSKEGNEYLAKRSGAGVWSVTDLQPPRLAAPFYQAFSSDLSTGILDSSEALSAGVPAEYHVLYSTVLGSDAYSPFFTVMPPHRSHEEFMAYRVPANYFASPPLAYAGASSDMRHLLFEANDALTKEAVDGGLGANNLYDSVEGRLRSVNVLPSGEPEANATFGGIQQGGPDFRSVISSDGSRIFWTDLNTGEIYVRENEASSHPTTVPVGNGMYWTASADGSLVFYTSAGVLDQYDVESGITTDLSVDGNPGEEAGVQGVLGASEDGSYVYFAATGNLASGATVGEDNLYVSHDGAVAFIANLASTDGVNSSMRAGREAGDWGGYLGLSEAQVTPDGRRLAFVSTRNLTGYESAGSREIFVYDMDAGDLSCASCNPTGPPPTAEAVEHTAGVPLSWSNTYEQRWFSGDGGRVFFDSQEALVPQDTNGQVDAYEWERTGEGTCQRPGGCIYLLSSGTNSDGSFVLDASPNGDDVFIATRGQLVEGDRNEVFDVYDVRVGAREAPAGPVCPSGVCQSPAVVAPVFATPSSATFSGVGNVSQSASPVVAMKKVKRKPAKCGKGRKLKRGRCVKVKAKGRTGNARVRSTREGK
jgi:WD40-like Beta Propeller Repeat